MDSPLSTALVSLKSVAVVLVYLVFVFESVVVFQFSRVAVLADYLRPFQRGIFTALLISLWLYVTCHVAFISEEFAHRTLAVWNLNETGRSHVLEAVEMVEINVDYVIDIAQFLLIFECRFGKDQSFKSRFVRIFLAVCGFVLVSLSLLSTQLRRNFFDSILLHELHNLAFVAFNLAFNYYVCWRMERNYNRTVGVARLSKRFQFSDALEFSGAMSVILTYRLFSHGLSALYYALDHNLAYGGINTYLLGPFKVLEGVVVPAAIYLKHKHIRRAYDRIVRGADRKASGIANRSGEEIPLCHTSDDHILNLEKQWKLMNVWNKSRYQLFKEMILIIFFTLLTWYLIDHFQRIARLPPGPLPLPIVGNFHQIVYHSWKLKGTVPMLNHFRKKYGDVFTLWKRSSNGSKYADRFLPPIFVAVAKGLGLINSNGAHWQEMRRFTHLTLRNMGVGKDVIEQRIMVEFNERCREELDENAVDGVTVANSSEFFDLSVGSVINSILIGKRFDKESKSEFLKIKSFLDHGNDHLTAFDLIAPVWLSKHLSNRYNKIMDAKGAAREYVSREAVERIAQVKSGEYLIDSENPQDLADAYISRMTTDPNTYTVAALQQLLYDLWIAGQDTTSKTLVSGFHHLVRNPHIQTEVRAELLKVTGNGARCLSLKDRHNTPLLIATLAEIQRHASIINLNLWRYNHESSTVAGLPMDAGSLVTAQLSAIHCHDGIFENPEQFDPSRFIKDEKLINQVIPFGIGKRSCVGENLARAELYLMVGNLLLRYKVRAHHRLPNVIDHTPFGAGKAPERNVQLKFVKLIKSHN
ncbi:unnamed protein product [Caenorhabditis sp. 36 PRJEB53466]|nr:unnamed protein product [Caenorhabditis sp. 36 PRJEB53466]